MAEESERKPLSHHDREELRLLNRVSVDDIAFFKRQQWSATNYVVLIYVAIVYIAQLLKRPSIAEVVILIVAAWASALSGLLVIGRLQKSTDARRERLGNIRPLLGAAFNTAWKVRKEIDDIHWLLKGVAILGAVVVTWLVVSISLGHIAYTA